MGRRQILEFSTTGIDDSLQGLSSSPYAVSGTPSALGLRIPPISLAVSGVRQRYLFCLATCNLTEGGRIRGIRQGLKIGLDAGNNSYTSPANPIRPVEMWVQTPDFRFTDSNVSWHLVREPPQSPVTSQPKGDSQNWNYLRSNGPAMLYKTFTNSIANPPPIYYQGLTAYTPPDLTGTWMDVGGLGTFFDIRFPWASDRAIDNLDIPVNPGRYSLYASVLQTGTGVIPATYPTAAANGFMNYNLGFGSSIPEEAFVGNWIATGEGVVYTQVVYWRIAGSLIVEMGSGPCCWNCGGPP